MISHRSFVIILFCVVVVGWFATPRSRERDRPENPDVYSSGYMRPGQCMSGDEYNSRVSRFVGNVDWSKVEGSATYSAGTKSLMGGVKVFEEMYRLGTVACPDLAPLYEKYRAARQPPAPTTSSRPTNKTEIERPTTSATIGKATATTGANIRSAPSATASIVRVAAKGATLNVFREANGWVQVGDTAPEGWISGSLLTRQP